MDGVNWLPVLTQATQLTCLRFSGFIDAGHLFTVLAAMEGLPLLTRFCINTNGWTRDATTIYARALIARKLRERPGGQLVTERSTWVTDDEVNWKWT